MQAVTTIGFDIAKNVFQVHGVDEAGKMLIRQKLARARILPFFKKLAPCVIFPTQLAPAFDRETCGRARFH